MTVSVSEIEGVPVASVAGAVDMASADQLRHALRSAVPNVAAGLVVDLTEADHLDSAGLHLLFETISRLERRQQRLGLVVAPDTLVADMLSAADVARYAGVDFEVAAAVAHVVTTPEWPGEL